MSSDDNGASTSRLVSNDLVEGLETLFVVGSPQLIGETIGSDGTEVSSRALGEDVLE